MTDSRVPLLQVDQVSKTYRVFNRPWDRLFEAVTGRVRHRAHAALTNVSLQLFAGEALAILGQNGAGKSTLLKLITGVQMPDSGVIHRPARITGLLELGTGFDPQLSGWDNLETNARLLGLTPQEIQERRTAIAEFSELGDFLAAPLRTYSSGMVVRLGFSIAIHAQPDCFVVDEALSVGDARFQQKCMRRIREFREQGGSLLFVSHDLSAVRMLCDRALVLDHGRVQFEGPPEPAVQVYYRLLAGMDQRFEVTGEHEPQYGRMQTRMTAVRLLDAQGERRPEDRFNAGETVRIELDLYSEQDAELNVGVLIRDRFGQDIFGTK